MGDAPLALVLVVSSVVAASHYHPVGPQPLLGYSTDIECYQRVAVGKKLNQSEVSTSLSVNTLKRCEQECERSRCLAFSFGISHSGNGTCQLANKMPPSDNTVSDMEYDLFYKNGACISRICDDLSVSQTGTDGWWGESLRALSASVFVGAERGCDGLTRPFATTAYGVFEP